MLYFWIGFPCVVIYVILTDVSTYITFDYNFYK